MAFDAVHRAGSFVPAPDIETRARDILGLTDLAAAPHALPIRVERMWRAENFAPHVPYTGSILIPMGRSPDLGPWQDAIAAVAQRHEALHSRLAVIADRAVMVAAPATSPGLDVAAISASDMALYRHRSRASPVAEFFATPINLFKEAGMRCRIFRDETETATLGILMHHYFGDAWSSQILRREIEAAHAALTRGMTPDTGPVAQYSDYALSQRRFLAENLPAQLGYWHRRLAIARPTALPFDRADDTGQLGRAVFSVSSVVLEKLSGFSRAERISLPMICLGAFQLALARWCGQSQAVTAVTAADRMKAQFRDTIGRLMAGIPLCSDFSEDRSARAFLAALAKDFYDAIVHRDLAFEQYDEIFSPAQPFCNARFNFIPAQAEFSTGSDSAAQPEFSGVMALSNVERAATYRDLHFLLMQYPDGLVGRVIYSLNFSFENIKFFVGIFVRILETIADDPDKKLSELLSLTVDGS